MSDDLDQRISALLKESDPDYSQAEGLPGLIESAFTGGMRRWVWITYALSFVMFGATIWLAVEAISSPTLRETVLWGLGSVAGWFSLGTLKMWNWMEMNRSSHQRDLKRLELALLDLSRHLERQK